MERIALTSAYFNLATGFRRRSISRDTLEALHDSVVREAISRWV